MALTTMYEGKNNSPQTDLSAAITATDTTIPVSNASVFPAAPNLATIGNNENAEVIRYNDISGNTLAGCERGFSGTTASVWDTGTLISREITKYDLDTMKSNIETLNTEKAPLASPTFTGTPAGPTALKATDTTMLATTAFVHDVVDDYAPLASPALTGNPTAATQSTSNDSTRLATTAFVQKHAPIHLQISASAGNSASKSDSRITSTMRVINCVFGTPKNVTSNLTWTTSSGSISFSGTFTGNTTIDFDLVEVN